MLRVCPEAASASPVGFWLWRWWKFRRVHRLFGWKFWAFVTGAAPLALEVEEFWLKLGFLVIQGYGLTETAPIVTLNHPFHSRRGTAGTPIGGVKRGRYLPPMGAVRRWEGDPGGRRPCV